MAASKPSVQQHFNGDHGLRQTLEHRLGEVRRAVTALQQTFSQGAGRPAQLKAEIRLCTGPVEDGRHVFTVTVTDPGFDVRALPPPRGGAFHPPISDGQAGGRRTATSRPADGRDANEMPPSKKPRPGSENGSLPRDEAVVGTAPGADEVLGFMRDWHREWTQQGGWLYDTLNRADSRSQQDLATLESRLASTQDVLGQSINAATASTVAGFDTVRNTISWLEQCRKAGSDRLRSREEEWRSSSATFHDRSHRDRERAEKRMEEKLDAQTRLLRKIAKATGVNLDGPDYDEESSLGDQLTAELNQEIAQAERNRDRSFISMDDDDDDGHDHDHDR